MNYPDSKPICRICLKTLGFCGGHENGSLPPEFFDEFADSIYEYYKNKGVSNFRVIDPLIQLGDAKGIETSGYLDETDWDQELKVLLLRGWRNEGWG